MAWEKVFGWGLAEGGAVSAACASAAVPALERRLTYESTDQRAAGERQTGQEECCTFSLMLLPKSWKLSLTLGG